ncbi:MAG: sigma-70 family RNA polymerase sigma factor [Lachnospiraceae bacterium]|nr:sigma-70 family RNA polymerase sigma factor [Lachnospiraceae bacterium]
MSAGSDQDGQLYIRYLKEEDDDALGILYEKYRESLILFLYGIVGNMEDAEELMMDTFAVLASGTVRYQLRKDALFKTWLYAIAQNKARMFLRKARKYLPAGDEGVAEQLKDEKAGPEELLLKNERYASLYRALDSIPAEYRQVLYLMFFEELKSEQIARILKKTTKQVYNLSARGKTALKGALERMGYTWDL